MLSRRQFLALSAVALTACTSSKAPASTPPPTTGAPTTTPASTTTAPAAPTTTTTTVRADPAAGAYTAAGPSPVGVTALTLPTGNLVEVWYPTAATGGTDTYDVRDFVPPAIKDALTADVPATYTYVATRDAPVEPGPFPVMLFSHGFAGFRSQSTFLTSHLASWGMIVIAPDHPARDLYHVLGGEQAEGGPSDPVDDLLGSLDLVAADPRFAATLDIAHIVAAGHSAGGPTATTAATDGRVSGYISMASGNVGAGSEPPKPSFFLAGTADGIVSLDDVTRPAFAAAASPSLLWAIDGVGHNGFDDLCTIGGGTGLVGVAEASGLGSFFDSRPELRALGLDGCIPPAVPVDSTFPIIRHAVTSWMRALFGIDPAPVGLGPEVTGAYAVPVTIEQR